MNQFARSEFREMLLRYRIFHLLLPESVDFMWDLGKLGVGVSLCAHVDNYMKAAIVNPSKKDAVIFCPFVFFRIATTRKPCPNHHVVMVQPRFMNTDEDPGLRHGKHLNAGSFESAIGHKVQNLLNLEN